MKKSVVIVVILIIFSFVLLPMSFKGKTQKQEVVFWTLQMADFSPYINSIIDDFERAYPTVKIKWVDVPFSEGEKRTLAAILSDNPPDLINLNPDFSAILAQKGALQELDEDKLERFNKEIISSLKYENKLYAIPWYATSAVTIYNKELFEKSGFSRLPKRYEDLAKMAPVIKAKTGAYVFMPTITENDTMMKVLNKYGVANSEKINSDKAIEVFDFYKKLYVQNLIPKETITQTQREALEKYMSGQIVFFQAGANFLNMIKENAPSIYEQTDVTAQIRGDLGQNDFSLMNLVIPLKSKNKDNALKFALFLTDEANQLKLAKLTNILATDKNALNDAFYNDYEPDDLISKARVVSALQLNSIQPALLQNKGQKEINIVLNTAVQEVLLNKDKTKNILDEVAKKWKTLEKN